MRRSATAFSSLPPWKATTYGPPPFGRFSCSACRRCNSRMHGADQDWKKFRMTLRPRIRCSAKRSPRSSSKTMSGAPWQPQPQPETLGCSAWDRGAGAGRRCLSSAAAIAAGSISPQEFHANWRRAFTRCAEGRLATAKARDHPPSWSTVTIKRPANRLDTARSLTSRSLRRLSSASAGSTTMRTSETLRRRIAAMARATGSSGSSARQSGK